MGQERQSKERVQPQGDALLVTNGCEICVKKIIKRYKFSFLLKNFLLYAMRRRVTVFAPPGLFSF